MNQSDESDPATLPAYPEEFLAGLDPAALIALMVRDEDRVPRNVIDACARYGEDMVAQLRRVLEEGWPWMDHDTSGEWWLSFHAAMILGLVPGEQAGLLLVAFMRRMALEKDEDMQDWLAGWWPALFRNKPASVFIALREACGDRSLDWYVRANALEPVIAIAERSDNGSLDEALTWAAAIAADETEELEMRLLAGSTLLDFAPTAHRPLLELLAALQSGPGSWFSKQDVQDSFSGNLREPQWHRMADPWEFYRPGRIAKRQDRWEKEAAEEDVEDAFAESHALPYVRETPKIGRNDPCPCGSGKKYKKCCLERE